MQWADEVEEGDSSLPPPTEKLTDTSKILTEYKYNDEGQKIKVSKMS